MRSPSRRFQLCAHVTFKLRIDALMHLFGVPRCLNYTWKQRLRVRRGSHCCRIECDGGTCGSGGNEMIAFHHQRTDIVRIECQYALHGSQHRGLIA